MYPESDSMRSYWRDGRWSFPGESVEVHDMHATGTYHPERWGALNSLPPGVRVEPLPLTFRLVALESKDLRMPRNVVFDVHVALAVAHMLTGLIVDVSNPLDDFLEPAVFGEEAHVLVRTDAVLPLIAAEADAEFTQGGEVGFKAALGIFRCEIWRPEAGVLRFDVEAEVGYAAR